MAIHTKESMYIVDSGASLLWMGLPSLSNTEKEDYSSVQQNPGHSDRQRNCGLRHTSKGQHQGVWRLSVGTVGGRFTVRAIIGKTMQLAWTFHEHVS